MTALNEPMGNVDRSVMRREFNKEALFIAGFTEAQINGLGDLSAISRDRMHEILEAKILYLDGRRDKRKTVLLGGKKRTKRRSKVRSRKT
jgi:hypothetical protein